MATSACVLWRTGRRGADAAAVGVDGGARGRGAVDHPAHVGHLLRLRLRLRLRLMVRLRVRVSARVRVRVRISAKVRVRARARVRVRLRLRLRVWLRVRLTLRVRLRLRIRVRVRVRVRARVGHLVAVAERDAAHAARETARAAQLLLVRGEAERDAALGGEEDGVVRRAQVAAQHLVVLLDLGRGEACSGLGSGSGSGLGG